MAARSPRATELNVVSRRPGRRRGEERIDLITPRGDRAAGLWFPSRAAGALRPWADLHTADPGALPPLARRLGPAATIMVTYHADETERALRRRVPPAATPLGLDLLHAGCRWLKDWYFAEGGREGHTKLQGELPLDDAHARRSAAALSAELRAFLGSGRANSADRRRALAAIDLLSRERP